MIEPYQWLVENAEKLGYNKANCGPASVDLRLGEVKGYEPHTKLFHLVESNTLYKGCFYLCSTLEHIRVPETHCGFINMRSSWARKGLGHKMAGFIDPGFEGQITLELETAIDVFAPMGLRIVQLIYQRLTEPTSKPYSGKYLGQRGATEAYA